VVCDSKCNQNVQKVKEKEKAKVKPKTNHRNTKGGKRGFFGRPKQYKSKQYFSH